MGILSWIIFGALAGWIASLIMHSDAEQGGLANIVIGIIGAFIGGALSNAMGGNGISGFNLSSLLVAVIGAVILVFLMRVISGHSAPTK